MSGTRQSELFTGQDWTVLYRAFANINFNSTDPASINRALREYVRTAYPEDFSDWIESSEFVAIIDLLSWLAGTLAYKTDLAARENFLDTAEARESILRLARFLSYNPTRARPAQGILKIVSLQTDEEVADAFGVSLAGQEVVWDDPDDPDWQEKFFTILNAALVTTNPFGTPLRQETISSATAGLYRLNNLLSQADVTFSADVAGESMGFEVVNGDFSDGALIERSPNPSAAMHLIHLTDGNGNSSARTGLFAVFKQGVLTRETFAIPTPIENQTFDPSGGNVTQDDVWVQTVDDDGQVLQDWTKVPAAFTENITYNSLPPEDRNIFSVVTRDDDRITIRFSDGRFGNAPVGNIRVSYRTCNGLSYAIRPQEIDSIRLIFPYFTKAGSERNLTITFSLQETVGNATARETEEEIRRRAPLVYATQNRMVSGEDYNTFPLLANLATKIKALNRVYSGHSRHIDLHDPTGNYSDVSVFADDGALFRERRDAYTEIPSSLNRTPRQILDLHIQPMLSRTEVVRYMLDTLFDNRDTTLVGRVWNRISGTSTSGSGYFSGSDSVLLRDGASILFTWTANTVVYQRWANIAEVRGAVTVAPSLGVLPPVVLTEDIPNGATIVEVVPRYAADIQTGLFSQSGGLEEMIETNTSFSLFYDYDQEQGSYWSISAYDPDAALVDGSVIRVQDVVRVPGSPGVWRVSAYGSRYVFESSQTVEFYTSGRVAIDSTTGLEKRDLIRILRFNTDLNDGDGRALRQDWDLALRALYTYPNGSYDERRGIVDFNDRDEDGAVDRPDTFISLYDNTTVENRTLFWQRGEDLRETPLTSMIACDTLNDAVGVTEGTIVYANDTGTFWERTDVANDDTDTTDVDERWEAVTGYIARIGRGSNVAAAWYGGSTPEGFPINFLWKHYAPADHRIDPAATNIHDIFVLPTSYDQQVRQWIALGADPDTKPSEPTEFGLRQSFAELEDFRMFSDQIVWRPVRYRYLFGPGADPELRAQFKIIKLANSPISDGEIRSRVVRATNEYFDSARWDFGETFFFTELAAYLHQQLAGVIGSVVIVPQGPDGVFGDGFEVRARADEMFISTAQVSDVVLISSNTTTAIRSRR